MTRTCIFLNQKRSGTAVWCGLLLSIVCLSVGHAATVWADFSTPQDTSDDPPAHLVAIPNSFNDVTAEPLELRPGMVIVKGTLKPTKGVNWGTLGVDISPMKRGISGNLKGMDAVAIQLASKQASTLRIRLLSSNISDEQASCHPTLLVQTTPQMKEVLVPLEAFESPGACASRAFKVNEVMKNLGSVQVTAVEFNEQPIEFSVGRVTFQNTLQSQEITATQDRTWRLMWADEFNAPENVLADPARWQYAIGDKGNFGGEQQYYRNLARDGAHDGKGAMVLTPRPNDDPQLVCGSAPCAYTSARLNLTPPNAQFYGRIEARIKLPDGRGMNASMALLGAPIGNVAWPNAGEVEMFRVNGNAYTTGYYHQGLDFGDIANHDLADPQGFHVVSFEWSPQSLVWMVDGVEVHAKAVNIVATEFRELLDTQPFTFAIGVAVDTDVPANAAKSSPFIIDYVRMYQRSDLLTAGKSKYDKWSLARGITEPKNTESKNAEAAPARATRPVVARPSATEVARRASRPVAPAVPVAEPIPVAKKLTCSRDNALGLMLCY
jgi:beta-glucanase (GH16 family)